jgi:hypothetical protein
VGEKQKEEVSDEGKEREKRETLDTIVARKGKNRTW